MRSSAAMIVRTENLQPVTVTRIAEWQAERDRLGWFRQVEDFITASGTRSLLEHVSVATWDGHYAANEDAYSAVVHELEHVAD